jgi:hypothetical protein
MGIRSMVQFTVRVAAFAAVAALLLQISCISGLPAVTTAQIGTHDDSGCHESAPSTPNTPDSSHVCCSGDHSPDALLSAIATPSPLMLNGAFDGLTPALHSLTPASTDFSASFSPPHGPLSLRI